MKAGCYIVGAVAIVFSYAALFILGPAATDLWVREDGIVEWLGAVSLLAGSILFFLILIRGRRDGQLVAFKQIVVAGLALLFFVGAGEEISWGQRIFGVATPPELQTLNKQGELNLHNLHGFSGWLDANNFFRAFWVVFGVALPVAGVVSKRTYAAIDRLIPVLPLWVSVFLVGDQIVAKVADAINHHQPSWYQGSYYTFTSARVEVTESIVLAILACGAYAIYHRTKVRDLQRRSTTGVLTGDR